MKLYFYSLENKLEVRECEADLKNEYLWAKQGAFPVSSTILIEKAKIGKVQYGMYDIPFVVLEEYNINKAKEIYLAQIDKKEQKYKYALAECEKLRKIVLGAKE